MIKDKETKTEIDKINRKLDRISSIPQISDDTDIKQLIRIVNKIIAKDKRG